jgi:hypothetical protein
MDPLEEIKRLLPSCSDEARRELFSLLRKENPIHGLEADWNVTAEVVLEAINRSSDLTQRMFRGVLAEAACKVEVIDKLTGWDDVTPDGNHAFDFKVAQGARAVSIQAKLQRKLKGVPWTADKAAGLVNPDQFVVEVQKTRAGESMEGSSTRPYRFGEFDIIAVSMEPVTRDWSSFRFTVGRWLIPRSSDATLIQVYQPVSFTPDDDWTDSLGTCIDWFYSDVQKTIRGGRDGSSPKRARRGT